MTVRTLVLASTSPFRRELLGRLQLPFETDAPEVDESAAANEDAPTLVRRLAEAKARAVASRWPDALIIGSDQVVAVDDTILGKPGDHQRAVEQLRRVSGKTVVFYTGLCLWDSRADAGQLKVVEFPVRFRTLSEAQIEGYLAKEPAFNCAGAFKSEGLGIALCEAFAGDDPTALIGLPLIHLTRMLERAGVSVL